ncbi:MAG: DUF429 domain-containing protein [Oligoflexia bacterium]|nr:DUF429 domain-containing protein [Oligoflexia bacterium]
MRETRRYLGLELAGAKNRKTALAVLEYYPKEEKIFLLDIHERIASHEERGGDEVLLELIREQGEIEALGVNVPLELPPCITCARKTCSLQGRCSVAAVRWMRQITQKARRSRNKQVRPIEFTPYTQRPIELWVRYEVLPQLPDWARFDIDETFGGNKAPLAARMHFLKRHLAGTRLLEAWPKLTIARLALPLELNKRLVTTYRHLEQGSHSREQILETLAERRSIFIYEKDLRKLSHSLPAFDAFICAYTALLAGNGGCVKAPAGFPGSTGWVEYPKEA